MHLPLILTLALALGLSACAQRPTAPGPAAPALPGPLTARQSSYPDKAAPVAGDKVLITDSEALNAPKQVSLGAIADLAGLPTWLPSAAPPADNMIIQATGGCSDLQYTDQATCEGNSGTWTPPVGAWTSINDAGIGFLPSGTENQILQHNGTTWAASNILAGIGNITGAGSYNNVTITQPATGATLTLAEGSSFITNGGYALTATITEATNATFPAGTVTLLATADVDDTPVDNVTTAPVSSNWAYDHIAASDPHTGYVLESAIGTTVQAYDADLTTWAGITPGSGVGAFLGTPSSANLASAVTDETGSGAAVFGTSPTIATPAITAAEVNGSADDTLTAAEVSSTIVYNTGQSAEDVALTLPTAASGYSAIFTVGTAQSNKWGVRAGTNDKIYLLAADGTVSAGDDNGYARMTAAQIGQSFACWTFKTDAYDWMCKAISIGTSTFAAN